MVDFLIKDKVKKIHNDFKLIRELKTSKRKNDKYN
jgi:hypothetical protein